MIQWSVLRALEAGSDFDALEQGLSLIDEGVYRISDTQYCLADTVVGREQNSLTLVSLCWAASEGAFRRVYFMELEADDLATSAPPVELLPDGAGATYGQLKREMASVSKVMEHASYRVMSDGAFVHKSLENSSATYHFRSTDIIDDELPYAIIWKCRGKLSRDVR